MKSNFNRSKLATSADTIITEFKDDLKILWESSPFVVNIFAKNVTLNNAVVIGVKLMHFPLASTMLATKTSDNVTGKYTVCHQTSSKQKVKI